MDGIQNHVPGVRPVGLDPLKWIELLASQAEKEESRVSKRGAVAPIRINGVGLSFQHPSLATKRGRSETNDSNGGQKKRGREVEQRHHASKLSAILQESKITWDLSYLIQDSSQLAHLAQRLQTLATTVESMGQWLLQPQAQAIYRQIRDRFSHQTVAIDTSKPNGSSVQPNTLLEELYHETIHKLEVLKHMLDCEEVRLSEVAVTGKLAPPEESVDAAVAKKDFAKYMTTWLKDNWTNPYPDDEGLNQIANDCATTTTVVGNWLINGKGTSALLKSTSRVHPHPLASNLTFFLTMSCIVFLARTRKWRPAIVKAFDANRPYEHLLEDSIAIFDGRPVREIEKPSQTGSSECELNSQSNRRLKRAV